MALVVQKYGGTSVGDAYRISRVAKRVVASRLAGNDVVVVVSAMGDSTDDLIALARRVSPDPPPREMDMLLTAGERISMSLLAMAITDLGDRPSRSPAPRPASSPTPCTARPASSTCAPGGQ